MKRVLVAFVLICCLPALATGPASADVETQPQPTIDAAFPNPVAHGDVGEFVVVSIPEGLDPAAYKLTDGKRNISLANATAGTTVAIANSPRARNHTDHRVVVEPSLALADVGEHLRITRNGSTVHEQRYRNAPEGEVATWNDSRIRWEPLGATDKPVVRAGSGSVQAFVLPDSPTIPNEALRNADDRILLAGYTLSSKRVENILVDAHERNVTVQVLLEGTPVGGKTDREARTLDRLTDAGVDVRMMGGPHARYIHHHAKYAVVDDRAVVMTENWKPAGTGGNSSRGWGVVTDQPRIVEGLERTFHADAEWRDARTWHDARQGRQFQAAEPAVERYPATIDSSEVPVDRTELLVTPDNGQEALVDTLEEADDSIDVVQVTLGDWNSPLLTELRQSAQRGVEVRILLSDAWYVREDNQQLEQRFEEWASERDAPVTVQLAEPGDRYEKIHTKGAVVDDQRVVLGSLNWNEQAATSNREVILLLYGEAVADYYGDVFEADWQGDQSELPVGVVGAIAGTLAIAGMVARRLEFER